MTVLRIGTLATLGLAMVGPPGEAQERYRMTAPTPPEDHHARQGRHPH